MATIVALTSNNWSSTTNNDPWPGGTKPGTSDTVQTGEEVIIEIDEDITVALLESTEDGFFTVSAITGDGTRTITADVTNSGSAASALSISNPTGSVVLIGNVSGGNDLPNTSGIYCNGIMGNITGNVTGGSQSTSPGITNGGTIGDITGDIIGGSGEYSDGILNNGGTIGDITGDITGGSGVNATGINDSGQLGNITGNVTGGVGAGAYGYGNVTSSGIVITGNITGGAGQVSSGIFTAVSIDIDGLLACGPTGEMPVHGVIRLVAASTNAMTFIDTTDAELTLSNDYPAVADVKDGVVYNRGTLEGELVAGGISNVTIVVGGHVCRRT